MPTLRRGAGSGRLVVFADTSPYQSRRLLVEYDGVTTAAYLTDDRERVVAVVWVANHRPATAEVDHARIEAGQAPIMPAAHTRHPEGVPPFDPVSFTTVWFEEGDGVGLCHRDELLAVIPGWANADTGMPGYSRDAIGQTPFAWSLEEAMEGVGPRVEHARAFWEWRRKEGAWGGFQQALLGHLLSRLGPGGGYWDAGGGRLPTVGVSERPATEGRPYTVLSTVGMSCQRMPVVEQYVDDVADYGRIELAVATTLPSATAAKVFLWLARYPWRAITWFGTGHSVRWPQRTGTFPLGEQYDGVLMVDDPAPLAGPPAPDLSGLTVSGDPVRWLWLVPITEEERGIAREQGSAALMDRLAAARRSWIVG